MKNNSGNTIQGNTVIIGYDDIDHLSGAVGEKEAQEMLTVSTLGPRALKEKAADGIELSLGDKMIQKLSIMGASFHLPLNTIEFDKAEFESKKAELIKKSEELLDKKRESEKLNKTQVEEESAIAGEKVDLSKKQSQANVYKAEVEAADKAHKLNLAKLSNAKALVEVNMRSINDKDTKGLEELKRNCPTKHLLNYKASSQEQMGAMIDLLKNIDSANTKKAKAIYKSNKQSIYEFFGFEANEASLHNLNSTSFSEVIPVLEKELIVIVAKEALKRAEEATAETAKPLSLARKNLEKTKAEVSVLEGSVKGMETQSQNTINANNALKNEIAELDAEVKNLTIEVTGLNAKSAISTQRQRAEDRSDRESLSILVSTAAKKNLVGETEKDFKSEEGLKVVFAKGTTEYLARCNEFGKDKAVSMYVTRDVEQAKTSGISGAAIIDPRKERETQTRFGRVVREVEKRMEKEFANENSVADASQIPAEVSRMVGNFNSRLANGYGIEVRTTAKGGLFAVFAPFSKQEGVTPVCQSTTLSSYDNTLKLFNAGKGMKACMLTTESVGKLQGYYNDKCSQPHKGLQANMVGGKSYAIAI